MSEEIKKSEENSEKPTPRPDIKQKSDDLKKLERHSEWLKNLRRERIPYVGTSTIGISEDTFNRKHRKGVILYSVLVISAFSSLLLLPPSIWNVTHPLDNTELGYDKVVEELHQTMNESGYLETLANKVKTGRYNALGIDHDVLVHVDHAVDVISPIGSDKDNIAALGTEKPLKLATTPNLEKVTIELVKSIKLDKNKSEAEQIVNVVGPMYLSADRINQLKTPPTEPNAPYAETK